MKDTKKTLILVSNDDGYSAKGINCLVQVLAEFGDVVVMAPHTGRSGKGCAITSEQPITFSHVSSSENIEIYSCTGTPADCVKLAFDALLTRKPDLVVGHPFCFSDLGIEKDYEAASEEIMRRIYALGEEVAQ